MKILLISFVIHDSLFNLLFTCFVTFFILIKQSFGDQTLPTHHFSLIHPYIITIVTPLSSQALSPTYLLALNSAQGGIILQR